MNTKNLIQEQCNLKKDDRVIAIGSDHGGWELKVYLKGFIEGKGYCVEDFGCFSPEGCDYPDIGFNLARSIAEGLFKRGILICGTGIGMSIVANKLPGIRAALCHDLYTARMSREHNDANIIVIGGRVTGKGLAEEMIALWLNTPFSDSTGRHSRRLKKIEEFEKR